MRLRSVLFVPCGNARAVARARGIACDGLIFDLEDAVGDSERDGALAALHDVLAGDFAARTVLVRVHPQSLNAIARTLKDSRIGGVVVPKVSAASDIRAVAKVWPGVPLWAMIETAAGAVNLRDVASAGVAGLIAGPNDLRKDLRTRPMTDRADILFVLSRIVLYGRANGLTVLDGVYNAHTDEAGFAAECEQGRSLGFDGKTLIHPAQIAPCERAFSPSEEELAWASAVVAAFENSAAGVLSVEGRMVERLHLQQAREILGS